MPGAAYVFDRSGVLWTEQAYLKASNPDQSDRFGFSLTMSADGRTLAVGASGEDGHAVGASSTPADQLDNSLNNAGAVYVFSFSGPRWNQQAYLKASVPGASDGFGRSLALSANGDQLLVGARDESSKATGLKATPPTTP